MSLDYYAGLLRYAPRIEAFRRGIERAVREGDRVLEVGTGLGTFAIFAARAGADHVCAVDSGPVVHAAREVARANSLDGKIDFVRGTVPGVEIPGEGTARFDVVIFEDYPARLLEDRTFRLLKHLGEERLAPGGRLVPSAARLRLAPIGHPPVERWLLSPGAADLPPGAGPYEIEWSPARDYLANLPRTLRLTEEALAGDPVSGPELPLLPPPRADALRIEGLWTIEPGRTIHALALWFDLDVGGGDWITNAPGADTGPWGQVVLPLVPALRVKEGGTFEASVERDPFSDGAPGWLRWKARSGPESAGGHEFSGFPASLEDLLPGHEEGGSGETSG